jgi:hypothetical protein
VTTYTPASVASVRVQGSMKFLPFGTLKITGGGIKIW